MAHVLLHVGGRDGVLDLSNRGLREVPAEVEPVAPVLRSLDLSVNSLSTLRLPPLPSLTELHLMDNALDAKAVQLAPLPLALRIIDLSANRLAAFPPQLLRLTQLHILRVGKQRLSSLPEHLCMMPQLYELDAGFNELEHALTLAAPGLPRLRRLLLRGNGLREVTLERERLPSLTELDLADNRLATFPPSVGGLTELKTLSLSNNRLRKLVSDDTAPKKRMWVASAGLHQLTQLCQLSLAQNELIDLPIGLQELRMLTILDVRCNLLSPDALRFVTTHCKRIGARLRSTSVTRVAKGLLLADESSAWHRATLLSAHVTHVLSLSLSPPAGVSLERLVAKLPDETALLQLGTAVRTSKDERERAYGMVTAELLKRSFHAQALRCHPDKQPEEARSEAARRFTKLQDAYRRLCRLMHIERRRLPQFSSIRYHFCDLEGAVPPPPPPTDESTFLRAARLRAEDVAAAGAAVAAAEREAAAEVAAVGLASAHATAGEGMAEGGTAESMASEAASEAASETPSQMDGSPLRMSAAAAAALADALTPQLAGALEFIEEARESGGEVLLHAGHAPPGTSHIAATFVALASFISSVGDSYPAALRRLDSLLPSPSPPLPTPLEEALEAFASQCLRERVGLASNGLAAPLTAPASAAAGRVQASGGGGESGSQLGSISEVNSGEITARSNGAKDVLGFTAEQAAADVEAALAQGWTLGRVGKFEVLFAPGAQPQEGTQEGGRQTFIG